MDEERGEINKRIGNLSRARALYREYGRAPISTHLRGSNVSSSHSPLYSLRLKVYGCESITCLGCYKVQLSAT